MLFQNGTINPTPTIKTQRTHALCASGLLGRIRVCGRMYQWSRHGRVSLGTRTTTNPVIKANGPRSLIPLSFFSFLGAFALASLGMVACLQTDRCCGEDKRGVRMRQRLGNRGLAELRGVAFETTDQCRKAWNSN